MIPKKAKRVFKGVIFDVYHWKQKMFDGSYETFERITRNDGVPVIAILDGKIALGLQRQPDSKTHLGLFGGRVERGETPLAAAKRELREEAGLASNDWELWKVYSPVHKMEWKVHFFIARNCRRVGKQQLDSGEKISVKTVSFQQFVKFIGSDRFWCKDLSLDVRRMELEGKLGVLEKKFFGKTKIKQKRKK